MIDLNPLLQNVRKTVASHKIAPGQYTRFTLGTRRSNPYGCADAANILYSLGDFPAEPEEQAAVKALQDGMIAEKLAAHSGLLIEFKNEAKP